MMFAGCSPKEEPSHATAPASTNVTLTTAQRQRLKLQSESRVPSFRRTIDTTGTVGFDNDRSTTVLSPISGPVTKLLVSLGTRE